MSTEHRLFSITSLSTVHFGRTLPPQHWCTAFNCFLLVYSCQSIIISSPREQAMIVDYEIWRWARMFCLVISEFFWHKFWKFQPKLRNLRLRHKIKIGEHRYVNTRSYLEDSMVSWWDPCCQEDHMALPTTRKSACCSSSLTISNFGCWPGANKAFVIHKYFNTHKINVNDAISFWIIERKNGCPAPL